MGVTAAPRRAVQGRWVAAHSARCVRDGQRRPQATVCRGGSLKTGAFHDEGKPGRRRETERGVGRRRGAELAQPHWREQGFSVGGGAGSPGWGWSSPSRQSLGGRFAGTDWALSVCVTVKKKKKHVKVAL